MSDSGIWVVLFARHNGISLRPLIEERFKVGADIMYVHRFKQAKQMHTGDRVIVQYGGPRRSDPLAQHLFLAGFVKDEARNLEQKDKLEYKELTKLTGEMFPEVTKNPSDWENQGIIRYRLYKPPLNVLPLLRPYRQFRIGDNFRRYGPEKQEYTILDKWWHKVVLKSEQS